MVGVRVLRIRAVAGLVALAAATLCSCSVYDPRRLTGQGTNDLGGAGGPSLADGGVDGGVIDCKGEEFATCLREHAEARCVDEKCIITRCLDGYVDCDTDSANGCETRLDTVEHCGLCGAACRLTRAKTRCVDDECQLESCERGYGDCDKDQNNGCETDLNSLSDCGSCGTSCPTPANAVAGCEDGVCGISSCSSGFGDCNDSAADGCEQTLNTAEHCGACNSACSPAHGAGTCASGACVVTSCEEGWKNCNGLAADGCETSLASVDHCGACGRSCQLPHVEKPQCTAGGECTIDHGCDSEDPGCTPGAADNGCAPGYSDCDGDPRNGCETDLSRASDCGACDRSCVTANTLSACTDGSCVAGDCAPGAARCGDDNVCRALGRDPANCGACGQACTDSALNCAGGRCTSQTCEAGRADCDGSAANGCETDVNTVQNCGICGLVCPTPPHATGACRDGSCGIGECEPGYRDCDGEVGNGCEVDIRTQNDCGGCGQPCIAPNAETSCSTGQCTITSCRPGRADCNGELADGCESDLSLPDTCGACENVCLSLPNVDSSSCEDASCRLVCGTGRADCDGRTVNGCEADLSAAGSCGRCGNDCNSLPNVRRAVCDGGNCKDIECNPGFADCNGDPNDGCERSLTSTTDCGACNRACALAHGQASCESGRCELAGCDTGYDDCNGDAADGCETPLSTAQNCGTCGNACSGGIRCMNGRCGCASDADCADGLTCCDGLCVNTKTLCYVWPCLPGFEVRESRLHCGGCGMICPLWCCLN